MSEAMRIRLCAAERKLNKAAEWLAEASSSIREAALAAGLSDRGPVEVYGPAHGELDVKRLYLPGVVIPVVCPGCGTARVHDLGDDYLSYPKLGGEISYSCCCQECDAGWSQPIRLVVTVEKL